MARAQVFWVVYVLFGATALVSGTPARKSKEVSDGPLTCPGFPGYCSESYVGDTCTVVCARGRNNVPQCQEDGTWTDIPRCIEHDPGVEEQVTGICPGIPGYCSLNWPGALCEFECPLGPAIRSSCTPDGTWEPYPTCEGDPRETQDGCNPCPGPEGGPRNRTTEAGGGNGGRAKAASRGNNNIPRNGGKKQGGGGNRSGANGNRNGGGTKQTSGGNRNRAQSAGGQQSSGGGNRNSGIQNRAQVAGQNRSQNVGQSQNKRVEQSRTQNRGQNQNQGGGQSRSQNREQSKNQGGGQSRSQNKEQSQNQGGGQSRSQNREQSQNQGGVQNSGQNSPNQSGGQSAGQCPGTELQACIDVCPGFSARVFGACVAGCAKRCPARK